MCDSNRASSWCSNLPRSHAGPIWVHHKAPRRSSDPPYSSPEECRPRERTRKINKGKKPFSTSSARIARVEASAGGVGEGWQSGLSFPRDSRVTVGVGGLCPFLGLVSVWRQIGSKERSVSHRILKARQLPRTQSFGASRGPRPFTDTRPSVNGPEHN